MKISLAERLNLKNFIINDYIFCLTALLLLIIANKIAIVFYAVPFTFGNLALYIIAFLLGTKRVIYVMSSWLVLGLMGLPVFIEGSIYNLTMTLGYIIGFFMAAVFMSTLGSLKNYSLFKLMIYIIFSTLIIMIFGYLWLAIVTNFKIAFFVGILPFIKIELFKVVIATCVINYLRKQNV